MKNKTFKVIGLAVFSAMAILSSCTKDDAIGSGKINYQVKSTGSTAKIESNGIASGLVGVTGSSNTLSFTSGSLNVSEIDFEAEKENMELEYELKKFMNIDLFNLGPVLGGISVPDGVYKEVELKLVLKKSTDNTVPFSLKGAYKDAGGATTPVEFYFNEDFEMEVEAEDVTISSSNDYIGLINLQLNELLSNISANDLSGANKTNGTIVISSASNVAVYNKFKANLNAFGDCDFKD